MSEKVIAYQIRNYVENNSLISRHQFGFRENHSTQSLLLQLTNKWLTALDNAPTAKAVCLTALDIKKAFDTIDHETLLSKLSNLFNFHPTAIQLIYSYLSNRVQSVKVNNSISDPLPIRTGVPQGSVIGPLLFILFINDLTNIGSCYLFADDCIIEQTGDTLETAISQTNRQIKYYTDWYRSNLLKINANKSAVLLLTNRPTNTDRLQPVTVDGLTVPFNHSLKYLGLTLDRALNWNNHIINVKNKVMPIVWNFARTRRLMDFTTALTYYTSIIRPNLEYASAVLHNMSNTNSETIETIQNRRLRIITQCHPHTPSTVLRNQLHIPSLKQRRTYLFLCEFYKLYHNISNTVTDNFMTRTTTRPHYSLLNKNNLFVPYMNKAVGQRALCYIGPRTFNTLPKSIQNSVIHNFQKTIKALPPRLTVILCVLVMMHLPHNATILYI